MIEPMHEFATFMDAAKMKVLFQENLPECINGAWVLSECSIQHPRYKTYLRPESRGKSFLSLAYHLSVKNTLTDGLESKILYAQAYRGNRSHSEFLKAQAAANTINQKSIVHIPDLGMVGWTFPYDPVLTGLPQLIDPLNSLNYFSRSGIYVPQTKPGELSKVTISVINYRPEIRCTLRYLLHNKSGPESVIYAKTYEDERSREIYQRIKTLWLRSLHACESFIIARPLAYDEALHTIWQEGMAGEPLLKSITIDSEYSLTKTIAKGLADLHQLQFPELEVITPDGQLSEAKKKSAKLIVAFPQFKNNLTCLIETLETHKPGSEAAPITLIHGDFHLQQLLLLETGRIALFDFDELALGDPMQDLANFSADLYNQDFDRQQIRGLIFNFVNAYRSATETRMNTERFDWHLRLQLLTRAYRAYIQQKPNLEQLVTQFLVAAEFGYVDKHTG